MAAPIASRIRLPADYGLSEDSPLLGLVRGERAAGVPPASQETMLSWTSQG